MSLSFIMLMLNLTLTIPNVPFSKNEILINLYIKKIIWEIVELPIEYKANQQNAETILSP